MTPSPTWPRRAPIWRIRCWGTRYIACVTAIAGHRDRSAEAMLGSVDAMKLRSSLTLFAAAGAPPIVAATLNRLFGAPDPATLALIAG
nr:DUF1810 family protein [Sphingomonas adhaesiva]